MDAARADNPAGSSPAGSVLHEYEDVCANMRHYSTLRFAQLTIFLAASGGLLALVFPEERLVIKLAGLLVTLTFWLLEERVALYWRSYYLRALKLEEALGYRQHTDRPRSAFFKGRVATRLLFGSAVFFWLAALLGRTLH